MQSNRCMARDNEGKRRERHKPVGTVVDGKPGASCAYCGAVCEPDGSADVLQGWLEYFWRNYVRREAI